MNGEQRSGDGQFGHDIGPAHKLRIEDFAIESHRSLHLLCPNDIFQFLDLHEAPIAKPTCFGNSAKRAGLDVAIWHGLFHDDCRGNLEYECSIFSYFGRTGRHGIAADVDSRRATITPGSKREEARKKRA